MAARHTYKTVGALPGSGVIGDIYYISSTEHYYGWNGSAFVDMGIFSTQADAYAAAAALRLTADETAEVALTGNQTIAGTKTFSGPVVMTGLPTSDPHVVGHLWANSGVVTVSAG